MPAGSACKDDSAVVEIEAREVHFYELHEYLELGVISYENESPTFVGEFMQVELDTFGRNVIVMKRAKDRHFVMRFFKSLSADKTAKDEVYFRC